MRKVSATAPDHRESDRDARRRRGHAKDLIRERECPINQWGRLQERDAVVGGKKPLPRFHHLPRATRELALDAVVEIAPAGGPDMQDGGEPKQESEKGVTRRGRIQDLRLKKGVFEREGASAGDHGRGVVRRNRRGDTDPSHPERAATSRRASG